MKKFATSILLFVYVVVSTGFVVSAHYCMDELKGVELGHSTPDECGQCGMPIDDNDGCCKDEVRVMKMQVDQTVAKIIKADFSVPVIITKTTEFSITPTYTRISKAEPVANAPPLDGQDIHLQNCVFRI